MKGKEKVVSGCYQIRNVINDKIYIGSSKHIKERWMTHKDLLNRNVHFNQKLQRSYNKYGSENFVFEILEYIPQLERESKEDFKLRLVDVREQHYLDTLLFAQEFIQTKGKDLKFQKLGFNLKPTASSQLGTIRSKETNEKSLKTRKENGNLNHTEESKQKMSIVQKQRERRICPFCLEERAINIYGRHIISCEIKKNTPPKEKAIRTEECKENLRIKNTGKKQSLETIEKRKQTRIKNGTYRLSPSEEVKKEISKSNIGKTRLKSKEEIKRIQLTVPRKICDICGKEIKLIFDNYNRHNITCKRNDNKNKQKND